MVDLLVSFIDRLTGVKPWEIPIGIVLAENQLVALNRLPLNIDHDPDFSKRAKER